MKLHLSSYNSRISKELVRICYYFSSDFIMELSLSIGAFIKTVQDVIKTFLKNEQLSFAWIVCESIKKDLIWTSNLIIFNLVDKNFTLLIIYCYRVFFARKKSAQYIFVFRCQKSVFHRILLHFNQKSSQMEPLKW